MQYRKDNKSGNELSILGFGCMRFPQKLGIIDMEKTEKLIMDSIHNGVNYFDTAYIYTGSEAALGQILEKNKVRDKIYIATKLPIYLCKNYSDFDKFLNTQLERLRTDYIDYYFMHMLCSPSQWENLCKLGIEKWIAEKKASGKIRNVGFSYHGKRDDFAPLVDAYEWDFCQIQYNYVNINYQAGEKGLKYANSKGLPVIIMEPLLGGKLATGLPADAVSAFKSADSSFSPVAWALRWLWNQPEVTVVLSGMNEFSQLNENILLAEKSIPNMLTEKENDTFDNVIKIFNESYKIPCTGCGYCMPCPKNVNIPACFAAYNSSFAIDKGTGRQQYLTGTGVTSKFPAYAGLCVKCGKCEKHCPQNIKIREQLDVVEKRMEPFWFKAMSSVIKFFVH